MLSDSDGLTIDAETGVVTLTNTDTPTSLSFSVVVTNSGGTDGD